MGFKSYAGASGSFKAGASAGGGATANAAGAARGMVGPGGWHPTVLYMLALIIAEIIAVAFLSRTLLR
jgi:hypothetical protein